MAKATIQNLNKMVETPKPMGKKKRKPSLFPFRDYSSEDLIIRLIGYGFKVKDLTCSEAEDGTDVYQVTLKK